MDCLYFTVPKLEKWQHYKERTPPWIKLHRDIFNDYKFSCLQDASKLHLMLIWLLASQMDNKVPCDCDWLSKKLGVSSQVNLRELQEHGFIEVLENASVALSDCKQSAIVETETETETETEKAVCVEAETTSAPEDAIPLLVFPIIGKKKQFPIFQKDIDEWQETYLGVDVLADLKKCRQWNLDNPQKRKTSRGIRTHISAWLGRTQDSSSKKRTVSAEVKPRTMREEAVAYRDAELERIEKGLKDGTIDFGFSKDGSDPALLPLPE